MSLNTLFFHPETKSPNYLSIGSLILIAYVFSIFVRMIWVYQFSGSEMSYWNDQLMINTNDGYYFAEGARDILSAEENINATSPVHEALAITTALLSKVVPFSFETIILYL
ncbi:MAG: hypothetical protein V2J13_10915, partial [Cycloclasticus sp.]|nr:hypothetical protein [Cycloclasticus sp.]